MDGWLKALIAVACIVVIVAGGHYAWSEWQHAADRAIVQKRQADAIRRQDERAARKAIEAVEALARRARAREDALPTLLRNHCQQQVTSLRVALNQSSAQAEFYREEVDRCIADGHISRETVQSLLPKAVN